MKFLVLFAAVAALAFMQLVNADLDQEWQEYKTKHNKSYPDPAEEALRKEIFEAKLVTIKAHNEKFEKGELTYTLGLNQFSDRTSEELKQMHGVRLPMTNSRVVRSVQDEEWVAFKAKHNKSYPDPEEDALRKAIFLKRLAEIKEHNEKYEKGEFSFSLNPSQYSDRTPEENSRMGGLIVPTNYGQKTRFVRSLDKEWEDFKTEYNKSYTDPAEDTLRKEIFEANLALIKEHNDKYKKGEVSYELGANQFSDRKDEELAKMTGKKFTKTV